MSCSFVSSSIYVLLFFEAGHPWDPHIVMKNNGINELLRKGSDLNLYIFQRFEMDII